MLNLFPHFEEYSTNEDPWGQSALISILGAVLVGLFYLVAGLIFYDSISIILASILVMVLAVSLIIVLPKKSKIEFGFKIFTYLIATLIYYAAIIISPRSGSYLSLILVFPPLIIANIGIKKGGLYSSIFGIVVAIILFLPFPGNHAFSIDLYNKIIIIPTYFALQYFILSIIWNIDKKTVELRQSILDKVNDKKLSEELLAKLSHQIRTPLNNIMIVSNLLSKATLDERYSDMVDTIQASTNNLTSVLNSMVNISTVDSTVESNSKIVFNLSNAINSTIKMFSAQLVDVEFNYSISSNLPKTFIGDPIKLKQVFLNVIECFIKNKVSPKLNVDIRVREGSQVDLLMFEFRSNRQICVPLRRGEILKGTNNKDVLIDQLDLTISRQIIKHNGGDFSVTLNPEDAVVEFSYFIRSNSPRTMVQAQGLDDIGHGDKVQHGGGQVFAASSSVDLSNANVLLVEDNLINQKIVILSLKKVVKSIDVANNGKEALDKFGTSKYNIILMDIQMPIMNGYVTTRKIREIETSINTHTPIIAITANALLGDREECIASGMDDYISKPFQIEVLIQKMKTLLGGK